MKYNGVKRRKSRGKKNAEIKKKKRENAEKNRKKE